MVSGLSKRLIVTLVNKDGLATGGFAAINIAPSIADDERSGEVDLKKARCPQHHSGCWFAKLGRLALAWFIADLHMVDWQFGAHFPMDGLDHGLILRSPTDIRLVRDDDEQEAALLEQPAGLRDAWENFKIRETRGGKRAAFHHHCAVDHPVAIQKNCAHLACYLTLSHFV